MKKICFVLPKYAPENIGGAELQVYYLAKELTKKKFEVHYIREQHPTMLNDAVHENIVLHTIPHQRFFFMQFLNLPFIWKAMKAIKADYWYVRVSMWNLVLVKFVSRFVGGKVIWACSHDREVSIFKPRTNSKIKQLFERIEHTCFISALRQTKYRLVQTEKQQDLLQKNYALESTVLQNSHPIPAANNEKRKDTVLWVANMRDFKRPHLFIELAKKLSMHNINCIMVGAADNPILKAEISDVQNSYANFEYLGALPIEKVYEQMQMCKVFVNTSIEEGFPNTFIQAWLSGVPVVTLGVDPSNVIQNYNLGEVTTSVEAMQEAVLQLLSSETTWLKHSQSIRQYAVSNFNIAAYVQKFINISGIKN